MIPRRITRPVLVAAVVAGLAVAPALGAPLSASAYRSQADGICAAAQKKLAKVPQPTTSAKVAGWLSGSLMTVGPSLDALRRLQPPDSLRARATRYTTLQAQQQGVLQDLLSRIRRGADPVKSLRAAIPDINARTARIKVAAHAVGFRVCGVDASG